TEIFILDGRLQVIGRGSGRLRMDLEPGIYKVKVRAGCVTSEKHVVLGDRPVPPVVFGPLSFSTPALLDGTAKTHEYQVAAAVQECGQVNVTAGSGSSIFLFARAWTGPEGQEALPAVKTHPAEGLSLHKADGGLIANFKDRSVSDLSRDPWAACNVQ